MITQGKQNSKDDIEKIKIQPSLNFKTIQGTDMGKISDRLLKDLKSLNYLNLFIGIPEKSIRPSGTSKPHGKPQICLTFKNFMPISCCPACKSATLGMTSQSFGNNMLSDGHDLRFSPRQSLELSTVVLGVYKE